jgi:predicted nucleotidyltransferase
MNWNIDDHIIFETISGSRLYGTNLPESDTDYRGVCIPPMKVLLDPFQQFKQKDHGFQEKDRVIYGLSKFMYLCSECNPNIVELLFSPPEFWKTKSPQWNLLVENRDLFLSKQARFTFSGYAFSQLGAIEHNKHNFPYKPAMHLMRLIYEGKELLLTGNITLPLPQKDELLEIRKGNCTYEYIMEKAKSMDDDFERCYSESPLPENPDLDRLKELYYEIISIKSDKEKIL